MANAGAFKKGVKKPNQGKRGPGKATTEFRQTVQMLLDENRDNLSIWLAAVAEKEPGKALGLLKDLAEYAAPKLARHEHTGKDGEALTVNLISQDSGLL